MYHIYLDNLNYCSLYILKPKFTIIYASYSRMQSLIKSRFIAQELMKSIDFCKTIRMIP